MAIELKLMHGATTVSLKASADSGWRLASGGWFPVSAPMGSDEPVVETINLVCDAASHNALATDAQDLDYMRYWAHQYMVDPTSEDPVWLHAQMQTETGARRALVTSIEMDWLDPLLETDTGGQAENEVRAQLKISRMPWWESPTLKYTEASSELVGASIQYDYTDNVHADHTPVGDVPARPYFWAINSDTSGAEVERVWMGFRSLAKHGVLSRFEPIWECEDGTIVGADVSYDTTTDVNGASPGSGSGAFVKIIPSAQDWDTIANGGSADAFLKVTAITLSDVSSYEEENLGDYLWLLRHKLSAGSSTWEVQLRWGYNTMADADYVRKSPVEIDSTSWNYSEMNRMTIPLRSIHAMPLSLVDEDYETNYETQIWARRTSGAANLYLDCFCPIPLDEGWLKMWGFNLPGIGTTDYIAWCNGYGTGEQQAIAYSSGSEITYVAAFAQSEFNMPVGQGHIILVYSGESAHDLTKGISINANGYWDRWGNLRGGE